MADHAYPKLPYTPIVAKKLGQDPELTELACKYLKDTGDDSLRAHIPSLGLHLKSNMNAAINLLEDTNKVKIFSNILEHAGNCYKLHKADDLEELAESAKLSMPVLIAELVVRVVGKRQQNHSDEFRVKGREVSHFKVVIFLVLEALKDNHDRSHRGFFVHGLLSCLLEMKRAEKRQGSDDENTSHLQPMQKKRRSKASELVKQDVTANTRNVQTDVGLSYEQGTQGSGEAESKNTLLQEKGKEQAASTTNRHAIKTERKCIVVPCTTCEKDIPYDPHNQSQQCVACRRKARGHSAAHQQAPVPTAVTVVAPIAATEPPRYAPTAVMVAPAPPATPVNPIEHSAIERASHGTTIRDFAPTYEQALQLQSTQVQQSDKSRNEALEQIIGNMSDFLAEKEVEKQALKSMLEEERREFTRQNRRLQTMLEEERREFTRQNREFVRQERGFLAAHDEIVRLEARIKQLEEQK